MGPNEATTQKSGGCPFTGHGNSSSVLSTATLKDPQVLARPNAYYKAMRTEDPVHFDEKLGTWLVSRYEDLQAVLRDPNTFSVEHGYKGIYAQGFFEEFKQILIKDGGGFFADAIMTDPPFHTRIRRLMDKAFTAHRVKQLEPEITGVVASLIDQFASEGKADGVNDFAIPMTIHIIAKQLGFKEYDPKKIASWSHAVVAQISKMQSREDMIKHAKEICELQNFLIAAIRDRQANPRDDLISDLVHARTDDSEQPTLTFDETVSLVRATLIAGNETTATALSNLLYVLATEPELAKQLYDSAKNNDERLLNRFVEELLRYEPPVRGLSRMTTREVELGGAKLPAGAPMLLLYASANDDETEFPCPREFDVNRGNLGRHVAFGGGVHRCIGAALARMEIKVAAREFIMRLDDIKLAIPVEEIKYHPTVATRSMVSLPLTFTQRK